jgi:hypothetical protein
MASSKKLVSLKTGTIHDHRSVPHVIPTRTLFSPEGQLCPDFGRTRNVKAATKNLFLQHRHPQRGQQTALGNCCVQFLRTPELEQLFRRPCLYQRAEPRLDNLEGPTFYKGTAHVAGRLKTGQAKTRESPSKQRSTSPFPSQPRCSSFRHRRRMTAIEKKFRNIFKNPKASTLCGASALHRYGGSDSNGLAKLQRWEISRSIRRLSRRRTTQKSPRRSRKSTSI